MTTLDATVRVRWEGAHRLPQLPGKCQNIHGHSWQAWLTVTGQVDPNTGIVADFSAFKTAIQGWIDHHLDHATMLGVADPLAVMFDSLDQRLYVFDKHLHTTGLSWPTVENVARLLLRVVTAATAGLPGVHVMRVEVAETENNRATAWAVEGA